MIVENMETFSSFNMEQDDEQDEFVENDKKKFKSHLYKPPTSNELNELRETENLFHSNLFRMQITELLAEISLKDSEFEKYKKISTELINDLKSLKGLKEKKIKNLELFKKHNIELPLSDIIERLDGTYTFVAPTKVELIGSFVKKSAIKPVISIDIGVQMPADYFNDRDFLNYRYFIKRILYMANVCIKLLKSYEDSYEFNFISEYASVYKPYLSMKPKSSNEAYEIRLHFMPEKDTFKSHRFNPTRNNVRKQFFFNTAYDQNENEGENISTMHYNHEILSDLRAFELNEQLDETLKISQGMIDGLKLLKLWLFQRQLNQGFGSFNNFIMSMYVSYLFSIKRINHLMSSYQIFRIVLLNLSQSNWDREGISMSTSNASTDEHCLKLSEFHQYYDVVFLDSTGYLNICSNMTKNTFKNVKHEAALAIEFLNNQFIDSFDALYMKKVKFFEQFDSVLTITSAEGENLFKKIVEKKNLSDKLIENYNNSISIAIPLIEDFIERTLVGRIKICFTQLVPMLKWSIHNKVPKQLNSVTIGLLFDSNYTNVLIKGPISNLPEAREFRNFWGDKSELRRFQDSTICEAVYFEANNASAKRTVYARMLHHILNLHLGINESHIRTLDNQLDNLLSLPKGVIENYGTGEERLTTVVNVFDELVKLIKGLKDMPLNFSTIQGMSSTLRCTNVFSPLPCCFKYDKKSENSIRFKLGQKYLPAYPLGKCMAPYVEPIKISCVLETSNQWPDDLECIARLKAAFCIKLTKLLRDNGLIAFTNIEFCDVFYKGYVFRLLIQTTRELAIMKSSIENGVILSRDSEESMKIEINIFHLPKLTSVLHSLQQEHNHFGGVARLAKRWLSSQLLLDYYNEEAIDLICAYLFVHPEPFEAPKSLTAGFIRFIELFSSFDFKTQPMIINFNNEFKKDDLIDIQLAFQTNRSKLPLVYIATSYDANKKHSVWTRHKPDLPTLCRTILLAKECLKKIENFNLSNDNTENFKSLFKPSTQMYDVIIHLKPEYCPKAFQRLSLTLGTSIPHYREYDAANGEKTFPIVDFDPVKLYVQQLKETYNEFALFFHDSYGATDIYVLWKPKSFEAKEFKIANVNGRMLDSSGKKLIPNIEAIVEDFRIIGHELVKNVTIRTEKLVNFE